MGRYGKSGVIGRKLKTFCDADGAPRQPVLSNNVKTLGDAPLWLKLKVLHAMSPIACNHIRMANWALETVDCALKHMLKRDPANISLPNLASDDLCAALHAEFQRMPGTWL